MAALEYDGDITLHGDTCSIYWLNGTTLHQLSKGQKADTTQMTTICTMPPDNTSFKGVKTMPRDQFISIANKPGNGKAIILR